MTFFKFSTVIWLSTTTEKLPPVVVVILRVICDTTDSEVEPHPSVKSRESLPGGNFSIFLFQSFQHNTQIIVPTEQIIKKKICSSHWKNDERVLFFFANGLLCHTTVPPTLRQNRFFISDFSIELLQYHNSFMSITITLWVSCLNTIFEVWKTFFQCTKLLKYLQNNIYRWKSKSVRLTVLLLKKKLFLTGDI